MRLEEIVVSLERALAPLNEFGFSHPEIIDTGDSFLRAKTSSNVICIVAKQVFPGEAFVSGSYWQFSDQPPWGNLIHQIVPFRAAVPSEVVREVEKFPVSAIDFPRYTEVWVNSIVKFAPDLLGGDLKRARELQFSLLLRSVEALRAKGQIRNFDKATLDRLTDQERAILAPHELGESMSFPAIGAVLEDVRIWLSLRSREIYDLGLNAVDGDPIVVGGVPVATVVLRFESQEANAVSPCTYQLVCDSEGAKFALMQDVGFRSQPPFEMRPISSTHHGLRLIEQRLGLRPTSDEHK